MRILFALFTLFYCLYLTACGLMSPREVPDQESNKPNFKPGENSITFVGHATVLIHLEGKNILTDPNFSNWIWVVKRRVAAGFQQKDLPPLSLILISHAHYDHFDEDTLKKIDKKIPIIVPKGVDKYAKEVGFEKITVLSPWESTEVEGIKITAVPAKHFHGRNPYTDNTTEFQGYIIEAEGKIIYFAGDTGMFDGFKEIGSRFSIDAALLPISAYDPPSFRRNHLSPEDALEAFEMLGARRMIPIHWGSFSLSREPFNEPPVRLTAHLEKMNVDKDKVIFLKNGQKWVME